MSATNERIAAAIHTATGWTNFTVTVTQDDSPLVEIVARDGHVEKPSPWWMEPSADHKTITLIVTAGYWLVTLGALALMLMLLSVLYGWIT